MVPKNAQKPPNFKRLLVPKRAHLHWAQDQGDKSMEVENRLGLMGKSKVAAKVEAVRVFSKSLEICFQKKDTFPLSLFSRSKSTGLSSHP